jgi:arginyl-tRNA synthetase
LTSYLFETAKRFSQFFQQCHVLRADDAALRDSRLVLCDLTGRTVQLGLNLLGIRVVDKM